MKRKKKCKYQRKNGLHHPMRPKNTSKLEIKRRFSLSRSPQQWNDGKIWRWKVVHLQDLFTTAVAKKGWWLNSNWTLSDASTAPSREIRLSATLLCSATCSIRRSSAILSESLAKLLLSSFAILWVSLKQLYIDMFCIIRVSCYAKTKFCQEKKERASNIYNKKKNWKGNICQG